MVEFAIVKFFDGREGKSFGFACVLDENSQETGEEIFFHANDRSNLYVGRDEPGFQMTFLRKEGNEEYRLRLPEKDDEIVFERAPGRKGDKASPWGYASTWSKIERKIEERPLIRVIMGSYGMKEEPTIIWEGTDRMDLSARFPKRPSWKDPRGTSDKLAAWSGDGGQLGSSGPEFEVLIDGEWERTSDPRHEDCCVPRRELKSHHSGWYQTSCRHGMDQSRAS